MQETTAVNILIVDDRPENLLALESLLDEPGRNVIRASSGNEALGLLLVHDVALVLMDVQMPEMDGYDATRAIRDPASQVTDHAVPIVAMTANAETNDRQLCLSAGMNDYIAKPVSQQVLAEVIERNLRHDAKVEADSLPTTPDITPQTPLFDPVKALRHVGGDVQLLTDLMETVLKELPAQQAAIHRAVEAKDADKLARAGGALKAAVGKMAAKEAFDLSPLR